MKTIDLSSCFVTAEVESCRAFYQTHFSARAVFDCGWYVNLLINGDGPALQFMLPQAGMKTFGGDGVILNFNVDDVDSEYERFVQAGVQIGMPLEDHPWGDRGGSVVDPIGISLYIYSESEPSEEFQQFYLR